MLSAGSYSVKRGLPPSCSDSDREEASLGEILHRVQVERNHMAQDNAGPGWDTYHLDAFEKFEIARSRLMRAVRRTFLMIKTGSGSYRGTTTGRSMPALTKTMWSPRWRANTNPSSSSTHTIFRYWTGVIRVMGLLARKTTELKESTYRYTGFSVHCRC